MKSVIAFDLTKQDRRSYIYRNELDESIIFRTRPFFGVLFGPRFVDVEWAGTSFSVAGTATWPHDVYCDLPGLVALKSNIESALGSQCYTWSCGESNLKVKGRKPDRCIGRSWAFHLWKDDRRSAYWQRLDRKRIKGLFLASEQTVSIAVLVFSFMFDWEEGANFK